MHREGHAVFLIEGVDRVGDLPSRQRPLGCLKRRVLTQVEVVAVVGAVVELSARGWCGGSC